MQANKLSVLTPTEDGGFQRVPAPEVINMAVQRLFAKTLASGYTQDLLEARIREIYFELANAHVDQDQCCATWDLAAFRAKSAGYVPSVYEISELINQENCDTIEEFLRSYIDACSGEASFVAIRHAVLGRYECEIGCEMEERVDRYLSIAGYPCAGSTSQHTSLFKQFSVLQPMQNLLIPDFHSRDGGVCYALVTTPNR